MIHIGLSIRRTRVIHIKFNTRLLLSSIPKPHRVYEHLLLFFDNVYLMWEHPTLSHELTILCCWCHVFTRYFLWYRLIWVSFIVTKILWLSSFVDEWVIYLTLFPKAYVSRMFSSCFSNECFTKDIVRELLPGGFPPRTLYWEVFKVLFLMSSSCNHG